ncbi:MAG TPA: SemiSWEET transporter [Caldimonas sp.]|nr:SemiSWEET transporter [Caldimonas sp.]
MSIPSAGIDAWIGYAAAMLTTSSFFPQAWLIWRSRDVSGISLGMYTAFTVGVGLWLAYGIRMGDWPIIVANAVTLAQAVAILTMKIVLDRRRLRLRQRR